MRVLSIGSMYPPHHLGGYELVWRGATRALRARGAEVRVLTTDFGLERPDASIEEDRSIARELRWYWDDHGFPRLSPVERLRLERHNHRVLRRELDAFAPDVVAWWAMGGMSTSLIEAVRRRGLPAVGFVHDDWMLYAFDVDAWIRVFRRRRVPAAAVERLTGVPTRVDLATAATWAFVSETTRRRALGAVDLERTAIASSGVDTALFKPRPERPWEGRLAIVGRIDERKGIATAVRALALLPDASLAVHGAGDDRHLQRLRALADDCGVSDRVAFAGQARREQLPDLYAEADAILFPVLWEEPWGLVPLEAMASGRPVVVTGAGGSGEYLRDGENCLLFAPRDDPQALAGAVRRLADDPLLRARLREEGVRTAAALDERGFNDAVAALLDEALDSRGYRHPR